MYKFLLSLHDFGKLFDFSKAQLPGLWNKQYDIYISLKGCYNNKVIYVKQMLSK